MKAIVTTTINQPTKAILRFANMQDWHLIVVTDKKTPIKKYEKLKKNITILNCSDQYKINKKLSDLIGWNCIQRRNFGFIEAYKLGASLIATVDDDNIPYNFWGKDVDLKNKVNARKYVNSDLVFDPMEIFNKIKPYKFWHRGFPLELLEKKNANNFQLIKKKFDVRADLWNGNPDIDSINRLIIKKMNFNFKNKFLYCSNKFSPFNSQNTFINRDVLKDYFCFPFIGRLDDIWASYYIESVGYNICYGPASVYQLRNKHNLYNDFKEEILGYLNSYNLCLQLKKNPKNIKNFLPKRSHDAFLEYKKSFS